MKTKLNKGDLFDSVWDAAYSHFKNPSEETEIKLNSTTSRLRRKFNHFNL